MTIARQRWGSARDGYACTGDGDRCTMDQSRYWVELAEREWTGENQARGVFGSLREATQPSRYVCTYAYVCMYACVCVCMCMYVCMFVCMYVCKSVCMYACLYVCTYGYMYVHMYVWMYVIRAIAVEQSLRWREGFPGRGVNVLPDLSSFCPTPKGLQRAHTAQ